MQTFVEYQKRDLMIGAFVVLSLVALVSIYLLKSRWWGTGHYTVTAEFSRIANIKRGIKVRFRGYEIGNVQKVTFNPMPKDDIYFRIDLAIENHYPLFKGTAAKIGGGLVGDKFIDLEVVEPDTVRLRSGDVIPGNLPDDFGETLAGAREMMRSLTRMVRRMNDADIGGKFGRFVVLMDRIADGVDRLSISGVQAFTSIDRTFTHLDPRLRRSMVQLETDLVKAGALLENADTLLTDSGAQVRTLLLSMNANLTHLQALTANVDSLTTHGRTDILQTIRNLQETSVSLKDLAKHPWKFFTGKVE